jgi:hypothetical protein
VSRLKFDKPEVPSADAAPAAALRSNPQAERIAASLRERGYDIAPGAPPTIDGIKADGREVKWVGQDYQPDRFVYCRANENNMPALERMVARGYVPAAGDVRLDGCYGGSGDVIMMADRDTVEDLQARRYHERRVRRGEVEDIERGGATRRSRRTHMGADAGAFAE